MKIRRATFMKTGDDSQKQSLLSIHEYPDRYKLNSPIHRVVFL
ncbi:hypothetical protein C7S15_7473 [Burkholderia cepacia]|nr:hypothetical protein [Burkholderia cepacia]